MLPTQETKDKLNDAYFYIATVIKCQKRWIGDDDMYQGYRSVFPVKKQLSKACFIVVYDEIKTLGHDNPSFFEPKLEE